MNILNNRTDLVDDYEHIDENLEYIIENILQSGDETEEFKSLEADFNATLGNYCTCGTEDCRSDKCIHGGNYIIKDGNLVLSKNRKCKDVIYECNENCQCSSICLNKYVQFGPADGLRITKILNKGYGLITTKFIPDGTFICEYAGEILTKSEAIRRDNSKKSMNYILCLNEIPVDSNGNKIQTFIDPSRKGNIGRYLNHSCDPSCEIISVRTNSIIPKIAIFAKRDINKNEELTFSYGAVDTNSEQTDKKLCQCGAENCQIYLPNLSFC